MSGRIFIDERICMSKSDWKACSGRKRNEENAICVVPRQRKQRVGKIYEEREELGRQRQSETIEFITQIPSMSLKWFVYVRIRCIVAFQLSLQFPRRIQLMHQNR